MAVMFGDPDVTYVMRGADAPHWNAHWKADNFDAATVTFNWGPVLWEHFDDEILLVDGLTLRITEAAPVAVVAFPTIFVRANDTTGVCMDDFVNDRAAANSKMYTSLGIAVYLTEKTQAGGKVTVDGYANTDDLGMCIYGRSVVTERAYLDMMARYQRQTGYSGEGLFAGPPGTAGGGGIGNLPPRR